MPLLHRRLFAGLVLSLAVCASGVAAGEAEPFVSEARELPSGGDTLRGTLLVPAGNKPTPVVLFLPGSGPMDRDGNAASLPGKGNPTRQMAEDLARQGVASLRFDKRGIGQSKMAAKPDTLRFETYIDDAVAWGEMLRKDPRFSSLTIVGHSEGSLIGMPAVRKLKAEGYVSLAGSSLPAKDILMRQFAGAGLAEADLKAMRNAFEQVERGEPASGYVPAYAMLFHPDVQGYMRSWMAYDPTVEIAKLKQPILVIQGTNDFQTVVDDARRLAAASKSAKLVLIENMTHFLKVEPSPDRMVQVASYTDPKLHVPAQLVSEIATYAKARDKAR